MLQAAFLPCATAWMTVCAPSTTSPPAKTLGSSVWKVNSSTAMVFHFVRLTPCSSLVPSSLGNWPMAAITWSHSTTNSEPSMGTGRRRPEASGSPSSMRSISMPVTLRSASTRMRTGATSSSSLHALFFGLVDLGDVGRHLLARAPVEAGDLVGALAHRGAAGVHGGEAAADDGHLVAHVHVAGELELAEKVDRGDHAVGVFVGDAHLVGVEGAEAEEDRVVVRT